MISNILRKKSFSFERTYPAPVATVWDAWTRAEMLREWWGPEKTTIPDCEVDARVGGRIYVVTEAGEAMGKYQGTRWPMEGRFSVVEPTTRLTYDAVSWTEGEEESTRIDHVNDVTLQADGNGTLLRLEVDILKVGSKAKLASFGMKWGYKSQLDALTELLERNV